MRNLGRLTLILGAFVAISALLQGQSHAQVYVRYPGVYTYSAAYSPVVSVSSYRVAVPPVYQPPRYVPVRVPAPYPVAVPVPVATPAVFVRPKYYVWGQPIRNTVRAITP